MPKTPEKIQRTLKKGLRRWVDLVFSCEQPWEDMAEVSDSVRHCEHCDSHVYDFVGHTPSEVRAFVKAHNGALCGQVVVRPDGRVVDGDCTVGTVVRGNLMA